MDSVAARVGLASVHPSSAASAASGEDELAHAHAERAASWTCIQQRPLGSVGVRLGRGAAALLPLPLETLSQRERRAGRGGPRSRGRPRVHSHVRDSLPHMPTCAARVALRCAGGSRGPLSHALSGAYDPRRFAFARRMTDLDVAALARHCAPTLVRTHGTSHDLRALKFRARGKPSLSTLAQEQIGDHSSPCAGLMGPSTTRSRACTSGTRWCSRSSFVAPL